MQILINNQQAKNITKKIKDILQQVGKEAAKRFNIDSNTEVSVTFMSNEGIQELNKLYRGKDCPTDVLSFAFDEEGSEEPAFLAVHAIHLLGEIVISYERAVEQALEYGHTLEREVGYLFIHGLLHLLGYDHQQEKETLQMRECEEGILAALGLARETI